MSNLESVEITPEMISGLRTWLDQQEEVFSYTEDLNSSLMICHILSKEIGGVNDDLARFVYDNTQKQKIDRSKVKTRIVRFNNEMCIQITTPESSNLSVTIPHLLEVVSCHGHDLIISPTRIARHIRAQNLAPVFVKTWVEQVIFSDFDPRSMPYQNLLRVLRNNDSLLYSKLVANNQVVFQGMHDIVGHIAGIRENGFKYANQVATRIHEKLNEYFGPNGIGNIPSQLFPFLIGLLLDDLTQAPFYCSESRTITINELLKASDKLAIDPNASLVLREFPKRSNDILEIARNPSRFSLDLIQTEIGNLCQDLLKVTSEFDLNQLKKVS